MTPRAESPAAYDPVGRLFGVMGRAGEEITMYFGRVVGGKVEWHTRMHDRTDGLGGMASVLEECHRVVVPLPNDRWRRRRTPSPLRLVAAGLRACGGTSRRPEVPAGAPAQAWSVLEPDSVIALHQHIAAADSTKSGHLLWAVSQAWLTANGGSSRDWMVPVNLRGSISVPDVRDNQFGYVQVRVRKQDSPAQVSARLDHLVTGPEALDSWWAATTLAAWPGNAFRLELMARGVGWAGDGVFSNLGSWHVPEVPAGEAWVFGSSVNRFVPVCASTVTVNGALGMMLRLRADVAQGLDVTALMQSWGEHLLHT